MRIIICQRFCFSDDSLRDPVKRIVMWIVYVDSRISHGTTEVYWCVLRQEPYSLANALYKDLHTSLCLLVSRLKTLIQVEKLSVICRDDLRAPVLVRGQERLIRLELIVCLISHRWHGTKSATTFCGFKHDTIVSLIFSIITISDKRRVCPCNERLQIRGQKG